MRIVVAAAVVLVAAPRLFAQAGSGTDIIVGRVIGPPPGNAPLAGARVTVTSLVRLTARTTVTRGDGEFTVVFRDGGGRYRVTANFVGFGPVTTTIARQGDEDRLRTTIQMTVRAQQLTAIDVLGRADPSGEDWFRAAASEQTLTADLLRRLPVSPGDLFGTAALVAGVNTTPASDTSRMAFSVAAQPSTQNNITLDGMTFLFGSVPQDAVRSTRMILNSYDVARGQFTGGQLVTTTRAGGDQFHGSLTASLRPAATQFVGNPAGAFSQTYSQGLLSGGASGPVGRSTRAFYLVSGELESRTDDILSLQTAEDRTLANLGLSPDSLVRFHAALASIGATAPVSITLPQRTLRSASTLGRLDVDLTESNQLMLRGEWRGLQEKGGRVTPYTFPAAGSTRDGFGGGGMFMLTSVMGQFINEARAYASFDREDSHPHLRAPSGVVVVASDMDSRNQVTNLHFGGNQQLPRRQHATLMEANNEISFLTADGAHRYKLGVLVNLERAQITGVNNRYGMYLYKSLTDLENNTPALFARTIAGSGKLVGTDNAALYISDAWRKTPALQITYGLRFDAARLANAPEYNTLIEASLRRQTRTFLSEFRPLPRFGLSYHFGGSAGAPTGAFSLGVGEFRGRIPSHLLQYVNINAGFVNADSQVVCVGRSVPQANWASYFADTTLIPRNCTVGLSAIPLGRTAANIGLWEDAAGSPRVWRTAANLTSRVFGTYRLSIDGLYAHGIHNPGAVDINLAHRKTAASAPGPFAEREPEFVIAQEGRPVFAPSVAIMPDGVTSLSASREFPFFATAYELGSALSSRTAQVTVQLSGLAGRSLLGMNVNYFDASYTWMRSRDQANGYPFSDSHPTTASDPRRKEWSSSDLERRHNIRTMTLLGLPASLELGVIGRLTSGPPFTPMVNGDVNGDGLYNDRAFVFSAQIPAAATRADSGVAIGMQRLLNTAESRTRDCLTSHTGRIATRNSCTTPWRAGLDFRLNWRPAGAGLDRRATFSLVALNALAGLDRLLHGGRVRGWGQETVPDRVLLSVTAFDSIARRFDYVVNEHFGTPSSRSNPFRTPFQLGLEVRLELGTDVERRGLKEVHVASDGRPSIDEFRARVYRTFPLPVKMTLESADSLGLSLTAEQLARLTAANDSINVVADTLVGRIAEILARAGSNPDPMTVGPRLAATQNESIRVVNGSVAILRDVLTPAQWALLPERIRLPLQSLRGEPPQ